MTNLRFFKVALVGALGIGALCAAFFYLAFLPGKISPVVRFFDFWIPALVAVFVLIYIRSFRPAGQPFHFWEGLMLGNCMFWFGGLFSGIFIWMISVYDIRPFEHFISSSIEYLALDQANADEKFKLKNLPEVLAEMKALKPSFMIWDEAKKKIMYSFVLVPLISMIIRRK